LRGGDPAGVDGRRARRGRRDCEGWLWENSCTPHKETRRLTPRKLKTAVFGRERARHSPAPPNQTAPKNEYLAAAEGHPRLVCERHTRGQDHVELRGVDLQTIDIEATVSGCARPVPDMEAGRSDDAVIVPQLPARSMTLATSRPATRLIALTLRNARHESARSGSIPCPSCTIELAMRMLSGTFPSE